MLKLTHFQPVLLLLLLCSQSSSAARCLEGERQALISIKHNLHGVRNNIDDLLPSWGTEDDCCRWLGIRCSNESGHVLGLDLSPSTLRAADALRGTINASLFELRYLTHLDLSYVDLRGSRIPNSIASLTRLTYLSLSSNGLDGSIPHGCFSNLTALEVVDLAGNRLRGEVPTSLWNVSTLRELNLSSNNLTGRVPETMSQLKLLKVLDLSRNYLHGVVSQAHFANLSELWYLDLSLNALSLNFSPRWIPPFRLTQVMLKSCKLGPQFPGWLRTQRYAILDISDCGISDVIPDWFWNVSSIATFMDLSKNQIYGEIASHSVRLWIFVTIDLSSNRLEGPVPFFQLITRFLDLSRNKFSKLNLPCDVPGGFNVMRFLDISDNELSGEIQDCWSSFQNLEVLSLTNNNFSGRIPNSIGSIGTLKSLKLDRNSLTGEVPSTLKNCTGLIAIDFGENKLSGAIPTWIGPSLSNLAVLILRSNRFNGNIPYSLCQLLNLQVLDLSWNTISGSVPKCIANYTAMRTNDGHELFASKFETTSDVIMTPDRSPVSKTYREKVLLQWKGQLREFSSILALVKSIDLASNKLVGDIPSQVTELSELVHLNISRNSLTGRIPDGIGLMRSLDALDLSWNHLVGKIPPSLARIDRLTALDLSNNNLSGEIPTGTQLQTFPDAYAGNPGLCGDPLPKNCSDDEHASPTNFDEESDELLNVGFYVCMAVGFTIAFWAVCGALIFNKSFRYAYFKLLDDIGDRLRVTTAIQRDKLVRMIKF